MLVNVPLVDQLNEPSVDGSDENARANCVVACLSSGVRALIPSLTATAVNGDSLKDAVYGEPYTGATDPAHFAAYLASQYGVNLARFPASGTATGAQLVAQVIAGITQYLPVTGAIPSEWATAPADPLNPVGGTHEVLFCDYDPASGMLTAMNPWPVNGTSAFYQTQPASWWAARLVYGRVFVLSGGHMSISIGDVSQFFTQIDAQHWVCKSNNLPVQLGILTAYQSWPAQGSLAGLTALGLPVTGPTYLDQSQYPNVCEQRFERGRLRYDPERLKDNPPGAVGPVYLAHDTDTAQDPAGANALAEVAAIKKVLGVAA